MLLFAGVITIESLLLMFFSAGTFVLFFLLFVLLALHSPVFSQMLNNISINNFGNLSICSYNSLHKRSNTLCRFNGKIPVFLKPDIKFSAPISSNLAINCFKRHGIHLLVQVWICYRELCLSTRLTVLAIFLSWGEKMRYLDYLLLPLVHQVLLTMEVINFKIHPKKFDSQANLNWSYWKGRF